MLTATCIYRKKKNKSKLCAVTTSNCYFYDHTNLLGHPIIYPYIGKLAGNII